MQVEYLEKHDDFGLCFSDNLILDEVTKKLVPAKNSSFNGIQDLIKKNYIATLTTLYRSKLYFRYIDEISPVEKKWKMGDYPMWLYFAQESSIYYLDCITAVYRILPESASHSIYYDKKILFEESIRDIRYYFVKLYNICDTKDVDIIFYRKCFELACSFNQLYDSKKYYNQLYKLGGVTLKDIIRRVFFKLRRFKYYAK